MFRNKKIMHLAIFICFLLLMLAGCSSVSVHDPMAHAKKGIINFAYCITSSSEMNTVENVLTDEENKKEFNKNIKIAIDDINKAIQSNIKYTPDFHVNSFPKCIGDTDLIDNSSDLYLTIELSGYGSIKKKWKRVLIGTGIAEGIIQGVVVGAATHNPWLGFAVGAEEIGSEYLTWNGVDWILGETYAPVTLEGSLLYIKDQKIIWKDSSFVTENEDELDDVEKKDKSLQLRASLHKAITELISSLNDYLQNEILNITHMSLQPVNRH